MREFFVVLFSLSLVACVTTKTSTFTKNISLEKEVEARVQVGLSYLQQGNPEMAIYHMREVVEKRQIRRVYMKF
jgi:Tfp pilus assembly protein PilF